MPTSRIMAAAMTAMARLVAMVLSQWPPPLTHELDRQPVPNKEQIGRTEAEKHDQRVTVDPIAQASPTRPRQILAYRQGVDVTGPAAIEITRGRMVNGVSAAPEVIGGERQHPDRAADPVVGETVTEERAVTAVVLDHEQADEQTRRPGWRAAGKAE